MRFLSFTALVLAALAAPAAAQPQSGEIVVHAAVARQEIERILREDSLTSSRPTPREVAETMAAIARGRAPEDFWSAYQTHVQAWEHYADAVEQSPREQSESNFGDEGAAGEAQNAIETTFAEVERIARRYGAHLPATPIDPRTIA